MSQIRHLPVAVTGSLVLRGGATVSTHRHDDHQVIGAGRGVVAVTTDRGTLLAPPGRAVWVPAGVPHEHRAYGPTTLLTVGLPAAPGRGAGSLRSLALTPLARELLAACADTAARSPARRGRLLGAFLDEVRDAGDARLLLPVPTDPRLRRIADLLRADPACPASAAQLARAAGTSERTLARLCRQDLGLTLPQWRTQIRLQHAVRLLADGVAVGAVAHRCGWLSAGSFSAAFRRVLGCSPAQWR